MFPFHRTRISTLSITCIHIIKYTFPHHHTRISVPHFVGVFIYAGAINRSLRLLTVCDNVANTHEIGYEHSARRRGRFIVPVSLHYQICIFTSSKTCFRFTAHSYPHYQLRVFTLLNTHFHITTRTFPFVISWVFSYMRAR